MKNHEIQLTHEELIFILDNMHDMPPSHYEKASESYWYRMSDLLRRKLETSRDLVRYKFLRNLCNFGDADALLNGTNFNTLDDAVDCLINNKQAEMPEE